MTKSLLKYPKFEQRAVLLTLCLALFVAANWIGAQGRTDGLWLGLSPFSAVLIIFVIPLYYVGAHMVKFYDRWRRAMSERYGAESHVMRMWDGCMTGAWKMSFVIIAVGIWYVLTQQHYAGLEVWTKEASFLGAAVPRYLVVICVAFVVTVIL